MPLIVDTANAAGDGLTLLEIIERVQTIFGDHDEVQITKEDIKRWANDGQLDIIRKTESLVKDGELFSVATLAEYPLPSDYLFVHHVSYDGNRITYLSYPQFENQLPNRAKHANGIPRFVTIKGRNLVLHPAPSASDLVINFAYNARPKLLVGDSDVPEIAIELHEGIVRYCLIRAQELNADWAAAQMFRADYENFVGKGRTDIQNPVNISYPVVRDIEEESYGYYDATAGT